ncbi:hypothetical protein [Pseudoneobacillus sp. C159]
MMFVKVYQYYIQKDQLDNYLDIQEKSKEIYSTYIDVQTIYLNSRNDESKWIEISRYQSEDEYKKSIKLINQQKEIQELFEDFQSLLVSDKNEISEEDFIEYREKSFN